MKPENQTTIQLNTRNLELIDLIYDAAYTKMTLEQKLEDNSLLKPERDKLQADLLAAKDKFSELLKEKEQVVLELQKRRK